LTFLVYYLLNSHRNSTFITSGLERGARVDVSFLPPKLVLDGTYERLIELLYSVFERDFIIYRTIFSGLPVAVDNREIDPNMEEGFWHVVTKGKNDR
jgi:hypothetical protein